VQEKESLTYNFPKEERLYKKKLIQELFENGSSFYLYPFKVIWLSSEESENNQVLFSVSKRNFKRAVDRNAIKRKLREAYRLNKHQNQLSSHQPSLLIGYIYTGKEILDFRVIESKLKKSIARLHKEIQADS